MRKKRKKSRFGERLTLILSLTLILLLLIIGVLLYAGWRVSDSDHNLPNISLGGISVGGLTRDETVAKLQASGWDERNEIPLQVHFPLGLSIVLDRLQSNAVLTAADAADAVFAYGHSGHWFENLELWLRARISREPIMPIEGPKAPEDLNETYLRANIRTVTERFGVLTSDDAVHLDVEHARMTMIKGGGNIRLDANRIFDAVCQALLSGVKELEWTEIEGELLPPDFESVYEQLQAETRNASFNSETHEIVPESVGCSFDIPDALERWENAATGEKFEIPVEVGQPEITAEMLRALMFKDRLCFMTTYFWGSSSNRITNIDLVARKLDNLEIWPGETFSYNAAVGERTEDAGFRLAGAYADGEVTEEVGGGICQVSSTLYCAAMYAQMTTVQRQNHYFAVSYLSMGYDATVSWTWPDYRFRNDRDFPVMIKTFVDDHSITIEFWGTDLDGSRVSPYTNTWDVYDQDYPNVVIGHGATTFCRILDAYGNVINTVEEPTGIYYLHDEEIAWPPEKLARDAAEATASLTLGLS